MLRSLIAYDAQGNVVSVRSHMIAKDENGNVLGPIDFEAHEAAGGRMRDIAEHSRAVGSVTWPEWLGAAAFDFKVELDPNPGNARARAAALVHKKSGHRRERAAIEAAVQERINEKRAEAKKRGDEQRKRLKARGVKPEIIEQFTDPEPEPADVRDILGGPGRPLLIDEDGKTKARVKVQRPDLPVVRKSHQR